MPFHPKKDNVIFKSFRNFRIGEFLLLSDQRRQISKFLQKRNFHLGKE